MALLESTRYLYRGKAGGMSVCRLDVHSLRDDRCAVICTELEDNPGSSITNYAAELATAVCRDRKIAPENLVWIEHNPARGTGEDFIPATWEYVTFRNDADVLGQIQLHNPEWRPMTYHDWSDLGLPCPG